jgi:hypothetical protein
METLADTIIYLVAYLNLAGLDPDDGHTLDCNRADDDAKALESVYAMIDSASPVEQQALKAAAERAIAQENASGGPRFDWLACYEDILADLNERAGSPDSGPA